MLRRSGRSTPCTPASLQDVSDGLSSSSSGSSGCGSEVAGSPPGSTGAKQQLTPRQQRPRLRTLLRALLPALVLAATCVSLQQRHSRRARLADSLLAATPAARGPGARQLGETSGGAAAAGRACAEALQVPQVAMLFLVKGPLRHEAVWRAWFERAAGLLPTQAVSNSLCASEEGMPDALAACSSLAQGAGAAASSSAADSRAGDPPLQQHASGGSGGGSARGWHSSQPVPAGVLDRQHLFDVYVHPHPNFTGYPPGSLLHGRELPASQRVATQWGSHSLVDAAEALLAAALRNPRATKFFMLSESDLPLYSPETLYLQLTSEHRSRLNACNTTEGWDLDYYRWVDRMETRFLNRGHWRKSSQWFVLNRAHAKLVLADRAVERVFQDHCSTTYEPERDAERVCYPDEHYIPTLLAVHGKDHETDCHGAFMDVDWSRVESTSPHPWEYRPSEVGERLFAALRRPERPGCGNPLGALQAAPAAFLQQGELFAAAAAGAGGAGPAQLQALGRGVCRSLLLRQQEAAKYPGLGPRCPLMARKFSDETVKPALMALAPCDSTTLILNDGRCPGEGEQLRALRVAWWRAAPWVALAAGLLLVLPLLSALAAPLRGLPQLLLRRVPRSDARLAAPLLDV